MIRKQNKRMSTETMVLASLMTALVVVFQCLATYTAFFGPFSTAIGLIPIVIGAAMCGPLVGAWLGFVFALVVIFTGGANLFFMFSVPGTIITVLGKGIACGAASGLVYKLLKSFNKTVAAIASAIVCPIVNTGIFLLGSAIFFMPFADNIGELLGMEQAGFALFIAMAFGNFLFEIGMNAVLSPVIVRILDMRKKK
ncbi:MAG: ECF transporter S component [Clostridia bacterium]|nr:ECF transporter S component [Clostridia bacterium]